MAFVQGTSDKLQEPLRPLQHGLLDPDEGHPFKEKNNHQHITLTFFMFLCTKKKKKKKRIGKIIKQGLGYKY
jgi:hypothetical protein